ncbi:MAG TPA: ABC transporter substrate-binding protein, partial [Spirochaetia bacterium]|nr:ABC transporter substrate-binding protein [Spirochaetia bacterium]
LKTDAAEQLRGDPRFTLYEAPASTVSLLLNPAPAPQGSLNPFSLVDVRRAMQYLVDRQFMAHDIYRGHATPMVSQVSPTDFDYLTVYDIERSSGITYDPEYGRQMIAKAMQQAGAQMSGGLWSYGGQPVRIKIVGRVEDERRNIADLVRVALEKAGFSVAVTYLPFAAAVDLTYSSDPQTLQWNVYTEGWGRSAPSRYDYANVNSMTAPWMGNMPGWQQTGFWQYQQAELDTLGKRLYRGEFKTLEERNTIYRRMTELGLQESVRVWLVTVTNSFPARKELVRASRDLVAGVQAPWTLREAYVPGKTDLTVGNLWVWTERTTWNPIGGFGDVYSSGIWKYLSDPPMWNHPFTGAPIPVRAAYTVQTAGPNGKLAVPPDAVVWNTTAHRWDPVAAGARATSRVVFDYAKYFQSKWHDGSPITMADVIYSIAQGFDMAYDPDKARIETALAVTARPFLDTYRGFRILDDHRLEVYVDYWHFQDSFIASYASPSGLAMPWEILAAMDDLVFNQRRAAYSDTAAARFNVPWLSLVMDRDVGLVRRTLRSFLQNATLPAAYLTVGGKLLTSDADASARYTAALKWADTTGNLVIGNGPFFLARYDPPAQYAELHAFRDPGYPFKPGDWSFGEPPTLSIGPVPALTVTAGQATQVTVTVKGSGTLGLRYLLVDSAKRTVVTAGEASAGSAPGSFVVALPATATAKLSAGLNELALVAYSDAIAQVANRGVDVNVTR